LYQTNEGGSFIYNIQESYLYLLLYFRDNVVYIRLLLIFLSLAAQAQPPAQNPEAKQKALKRIQQAQSGGKSKHWPRIDPVLFYRNLQNNVDSPLYLNQGKPTYFCGYAALTHFMLLQDPENYVARMIELYTTGSTRVTDKTLLSSERIQEAAGTLYNKGVMDINHADQMWFMVLSENYKGYLNLRDQSFDPGDENSFWAATNFKKFNRMLRSLTGLEVHARGADLMGPVFLNYYRFCQDKNRDHTVLLYLNNKALYPNKFFRFILPTPTHFVVLYDIDRVDGYNVLDYWDYGLRTKMKLKKRKFRKLVYGITYIKVK